MAVSATTLLTALSEGDVILLAVFVAIPVTAIAFIAGAGAAYRQVGKGALSLEFESDLPQRVREEDAGSALVREQEIRQLLEAKAYRQRARGEAPLDVEAETARLLAEHERQAAGPDAELREEVRQLVVARNERRLRRGEEPLDVEREIERQLRELENLGQ